jgi:hypothetical protein
MPESPTPKSSRIAAARTRAERAKTVVFAAAVIAFFGAMTIERGAHHSSTSSGSQPAVSSDESDDGFGYFDNGGLAPAQSAPSTSTGTS